MVQSADKEGRNGGASRDEEDGDVELLGWRTRLIERANRGGQRATTIPAAANPSPMSIDGLLGGGPARLPTVQQVMQQHYMPSAGGSSGGGNASMPLPQEPIMDHSTDMLVCPLPLSIPHTPQSVVQSTYDL